MRKGEYSGRLLPLSAEALPAMPFAQVLHHLVGLLASLILFTTGAALADEAGPRKRALPSRGLAGRRERKTWGVGERETRSKQSWRGDFSPKMPHERKMRNTWV